MEAGTPAQVVDAQALASSIVQGVFARLDTQQAAPQSRAERVSAFESTAKELLATEQIDKDVMPVMLKLVEAMGKDLTAKQQEDAMKAAAEASTRAIHSELGRLVERYAAASGNPDLIRELKSSIVQKTIDDYNANGGLVAKYQRDGSVDWTHMDKIVLKHVNKWTGTEDGTTKKPAGGPAMKNSAPSGVVETSGQLDSDSLNEKQREIFNANTNFAMKQMGLTREAAQKRSLELINKAEARVRAGKR